MQLKRKILFGLFSLLYILFLSNASLSAGSQIIEEKSNCCTSSDDCCGECAVEHTNGCTSGCCNSSDSRTATQVSHLTESESKTISSLPSYIQRSSYEPFLKKFYYKGTSIERLFDIGFRCIYNIHMWLAYLSYWRC